MASLATYIRAHSFPLEPVPTGEEPRLKKLADIRAVVFDIYGTLIISAAGDISLAEETDRSEAIKESIESAGGLQVKSETGDLSAAFHDLIRSAQGRRRSEAGIEFPEVEIREIWRDLLDALAAAGSLAGDFSDPATIERIAVAFECAVNPVWPMPGLAETLAELNGRGLPLGIVSNAQFYTPLMFPAFLEKDLGECGFAEDLQVYSYQLREGKPSRRLYQVLAEKLAAHGIEPAEALYVGNDMRNDIWPARAEGFRTALFAGDKRSLRLREDDGEVASVKPDLVITDLRQIPASIG